MAEPVVDNLYDSISELGVDFELTFEDLYFPSENESFFVPVDKTLITTKRKKETEEEEDRWRSYKYRRIDEDGADEEKKRKARLVRNRESALLSRQRKKHYVEELEDKVKSLQSVITDLNSKVSYFMSENATLKQTVGPAGKGMCWPPPSGLMYPWMMMPFPAYLGSHRVVPLLPIPRLKPQRSVAKVKKSEAKTKKVASVSVLGLIFCLFLFGALIPFVVRGTVLDVSVNSSSSSSSSSSRGYDSELLVASLFVPRNEKLVKLDGNLIIHPVSANKKDKLNSTAANGEMKQWFSEGVAGPMFSSEMCTEVFQFDVSSTSGAIRPASQQPKNNTDTPKPFSSMLVSVLTDPREEGDDGEMAGGTKSLSRVFIVVLVDGVKYVTYSCVLPHLVTT